MEKIPYSALLTPILNEKPSTREILLELTTTWTYAIILDWSCSSHIIQLMDLFPWNDAPSLVHDLGPRPRYLLSLLPNSAQTHGPFVFYSSPGKPLSLLAPPLGIPLTPELHRLGPSQPSRGIISERFFLSTSWTCPAHRHFLSHCYTAFYSSQYIMFSFPSLSLTGSEIVSVFLATMNPWA